VAANSVEIIEFDDSQIPDHFSSHIVLL